MTINSRHRLLLRVGAIVVVVVCAKLLVHFLGWEAISVNPLFSGIIAANVFLMGFLLTGVLSGDEERFLLLGLNSSVRVLVVVHCLRDRGDTIRIISARKATRTEREAHAGGAP